MNMNTQLKSEFSNPEHLPVEDLVLNVSNSGVVQKINALDPYWIEKRKLTVYEAPPSAASLVIGATDGWLSNMACYLDDIKWLLRMEHNKFWSHLIYYPECMEMLVSFLQEANPPYMPPYPDKRVRELYERISKHVMITFSRLVTNKESPAQWMSKEYLGKIIYDNYIFSIPTLMDLCLVYGIGNSNHMEKLVSTVFQLQPNYFIDLEIAVRFFKEVFKYIIVSVNKDFDKSADPPNLPEAFKGFREIRRPTDNEVTDDVLTFDRLSDLVVYSLDTVLTLRLFTEIFPKSVDTLKKCNFILSLCQFYENAIPYMYERLEELGDERNVAYAEVENYIDTTRLEVVDVFKAVLDESKNKIFNDDGNMESRIEEYLATLMEGLSEKTFTRDYNAIYPVGEDIELLRQAYPQIDSVKTDFILQSVYSTIEEEEAAILQNGHASAVAVPPKQTNDIDMSKVDSSDVIIPDSIRQESLISEVKDIFPDFSEGFILKCLEAYDFNSSTVINCILEGNLKDELKTLDRNMPLIPEDPVDKAFLDTGVARLNIFDGDKFDIMTRDDVDVSKIHVGKKKSKFKDAKDMLEDKSVIEQRRDIYEKYNMVADETDLYSDEYDDTYDDDGHVTVADGNSDEVLRRPIVTPRVLMKPDERQSSPEESEKEDSAGQPSSAGDGRRPLDFCVNPEIIRERRALNRRIQEKPKKNADVVGKARGQGQEKEVLLNRDRKNQNKSSRANHNRRAGASWKRGQGMFPS